jgi:hypothetical protein
MLPKPLNKLFMKMATDDTESVSLAVDISAPLLQTHVKSV